VHQQHFASVSLELCILFDFPTATTAHIMSVCVRERERKSDAIDLDYSDTLIRTHMLTLTLLSIVRC